MGVKRKFKTFTPWKLNPGWGYVTSCMGRLRRTFWNQAKILCFVSEAINMSWDTWLLLLYYPLQSTLKNRASLSLMWVSHTCGSLWLWFSMEAFLLQFSSTGVILAAVFLCLLVYFFSIGSSSHDEGKEPPGPKPLPLLGNLLMLDLKKTHLSLSEVNGPCLFYLRSVKRHKFPIVWMMRACCYHGWSAEGALPGVARNISRSALYAQIKAATATIYEKQKIL